MSSRFLTTTRAWTLAATIGLGAAGSLVMAPDSFAAGKGAPTAPSGSPTAGANCQSSDGKISGRGSTLQTYLQQDLIGAYANDVCGNTPSQGSNDITDPSNPTLSTGATFGMDWMVGYNYESAEAIGSSGANAAIGSGAGQTAAGCFSEAFSGTDIPATSTQLGNINNGTFTGSGSSIQNNGKNCNVSGLTVPFTPQGTFPNPGDSASLSSGVMVVPIGLSAVSTFANLPTSCSSNANLTTNSVENIWGGTYTNWNQVPVGTSSTDVCSTSVPITRVVRSDNSGTTQGFDNYLADSASSYSSTNGVCSGNTTTAAATWGALQNNQVKNGTNAKNWASGSGCSTLYSSQAAGGPALINYVETTSGAIGYADLSDVINDTNGFKSGTSGNTIDEFGIQTSASGTTAYASPRNSSASNCTATGAKLPTGGTASAVGLGGGWNLTAETSANQVPADVAFKAESAYPVCSLTWDFVWSSEDGNTGTAPPTPANLNDVAAGATSIPLDSSTIAGTPNSGTFTANGDTVTYTGFTASSDTLTGVSGVTTAIPAETTFTYPAGTGGPEANLTADQRRTLYSYFTYLTSPAAQATETGAGYASLPTSFLSTLRIGFQGNF